MCVQNQNEPPAIPVEKSNNTIAVVMYPFWTMRNVLASLINLVTLLIGIAIGIMLAPHLEKPAHAISAQSQTPAPAPAAPTAVPSQALLPKNVEQVQPTFTAGTSGIYLMLSHHIQSDEIVVNGIDLIKLQEGELNLLSRSLGITPMDINTIVNNARSTKIYQVAPPKQETPPSQSSAK